MTNVEIVRLRTDLLNKWKDNPIACRMLRFHRPIPMDRWDFTKPIAEQPKEVIDWISFDLYTCRKSNRKINIGAVWQRWKSMFDTFGRFEKMMEINAIFFASNPAAADLRTLWDNYRIIDDTEYDLENMK